MDTESQGTEQEVESLLRQGNDQLDRGDYAAGLKCFQDAAGLAPQSSEAWYGIGLAYFRLAQFQPSVESLNQALQFDPNYILALVRRGMALQELGQSEQGIADFDAALQIKPQTHGDWRGRGIALGELNRYEEAIASYDKAIEIKPDYHEAWNNRGTLTVPTNWLKSTYTKTMPEFCASLPPTLRKKRLTLIMKHPCLAPMHTHTIGLALSYRAKCRNPNHAVCRYP